MRSLSTATARPASWAWGRDRARQLEAVVGRGRAARAHGGQELGRHGRGEVEAAGPQDGGPGAGEHVPGLRAAGDVGGGALAAGGGGAGRGRGAGAPGGGGGAPPASASSAPALACTRSTLTASAVRWTSAW